MKKVTTILLCFIITLSVTANFAVADPLADTVDYITNTVENPTVASIGGEWAVIGTARSGADVPPGYFEKYYNNLQNYLKSKDGILHSVKYTEYSRVILALSAIGKDPENVCGYNLVTPLLDYDKTVYQGINGAIWAITALDCGDYGTDEIRQKYIAHILKSEKASGGWSLSANEETADADITAMVLTALAKYRNTEEVNAAVERGIDVLSLMQDESGGFSSHGIENSESCSQVIIALCTLGIPLTDSRFVKNGTNLSDKLLSYYANGFGFKHTADGETNLMATEQALCALTSIRRFAQNKNPIYVMSDVQTPSFGETVSDGRNPDVTKTNKIYETKTFNDIQGHEYQKAAETLAERNIINGKTESLFEPDSGITRAEFAAITVRALGLPEKTVSGFADVSENEWYCTYINTANFYGIVNGISETEFNPNGNITREEAAVMTARAALLCGMKNSVAQPETRDIWAEFTDYINISDWAVTCVAFCCREKIIPCDETELRPHDNATRGEIAGMICNMLEKAELL